MRSAKVEDHIADAVSKGAKIAVGGKTTNRGGLFFQPTILTGVTTDMKVAREETFGPVAPLFKFDTEEEVIETGQRHRIRPCLLFLFEATSPRSSGSPRHWNMAWSASIPA